jgi:hypothetical protein
LPILADEGRGAKFDEEDMSVFCFSVIPEPFKGWLIGFTYIYLRERITAVKDRCIMYIYHLLWGKDVEMAMQYTCMEDGCMWRMVVCG